MVSLLKIACLFIFLALTLPGCSSNLGSKSARAEFIKEHQQDSKLTVRQLLTDQWSAKAAQQFLDQKGLHLGIVEVNKAVSFLIDGMLDNCYGIACSKTGKQGHLCGGRIVDREKLVVNWYNLNSI